MCERGDYLVNITISTDSHSSRGVLLTAVRRCVWSRNLVNKEALAHRGAVAGGGDLIDRDYTAKNRTERWL